MNRTPLITAAALAVLAAAALPAFAASDIVVHDHGPHAAKRTTSKTVRFGDLDVSTPAGADALLSRIRTASRTVCSHGYRGRMSLHERRDFDRCVNEAVQEGVQSANSPLVTAAFEKTSR